VDFIVFLQESEGFPITDLTIGMVRSVLDGDLSGDEAVSEIVDAYGLAAESDNTETPDGCYPDSDVYVNLFGIHDQKVLDAVESAIVSVRMAEILVDDSEGTFDFEHLQALHARLFDDIYPFAGEVRRVPITRRTVFCLPQYIDSMAGEIFSRLREYHFLKGQEHEDFIDNLAYFMAEVHALHPFLDGNTRTMRMFFLQVCHSAGWEMNPVGTDESRLLEADIASLEGDYQPLISILHEAIEPLD
jgi:cell filamentation protein